MLLLPIVCRIGSGDGLLGKQSGGSGWESTSGLWPSSCRLEKQV